MNPLLDPKNPPGGGGIRDPYRRGGPYKGGYIGYFDPYLPYRVGIAETSSMGVVSIIIRIFVLMPYILYRGFIIGGHIVMVYIWWSHLLYVSLCWCPALREGGEYKAGWSLLSQLVPPTITKIRKRKFLYKLCIKKDCCIFVFLKPSFRLKR